MPSPLVMNRELRVSTYNLPAGDSCLGQSSYCRDKGYCQHGRGVMDCVRSSHFLRWAMTEDLHAWQRLMLPFAKRRAGKRIRVHSYGDFFSPDYFRAWLDIARCCPETSFAAYTRLWRVRGWREILAEAELVPNFTLWWSTDPSTGVPRGAPRLAFIWDDDFGQYHETMPWPNCLKQMGPDNCKTCGLCWDKSSTAVTFLKH